MRITRERATNLARAVRDEDEYVIILLVLEDEIKTIVSLDTQDINTRLQQRIEQEKIPVFTLTSDDVKLVVYKHTIKEISNLIYIWGHYELKRYIELTRGESAL